MLQLSPLGAEALVAREGRRLTAYRDSVGVWTIGIGVTTIDGRPVAKGLTITAAECDALFVRTVASYVAAVGRAVTVPLADHQADALISLCYNIGTKGFAGSTVVKRLNAGDSRGAAEAILFWNKPAEVRSRRQAEHDQFLTPYAAGMPRARSTDAKPVARPVGAAPQPVQASTAACPTCRGTGRIAA